MNHVGLKSYFSASILMPQNGGTHYVSRGCLAWFHGNNLNNQPRQNVAVCLEGLHFLLDAPTHQATCWSLGTWTMTACHDRQRHGWQKKNASQVIQHDNFIPKRQESLLI